MRVETVNRSPRCKNYEPHEDTIICQMFAAERSAAAIGLVLDRSAVAIEQRIYALRKMGAISGYTPRRKSLEVSPRAVRMDPPITLRLDDDLVRASRKLGGFPRAEIIGGRTWWLNHDNEPWRYQGGAS